MITLVLFVVVLLRCFPSASLRQPLRLVIRSLATLSDAVAYCPSPVTLFFFLLKMMRESVN
jgi:hypothetical protein